MSRKIECPECGTMNKAGTACKYCGGSDQRFVRPARITEEMVRFASGNGKHGQLPIAPWHIAANLNAMLELGYCPKCGLCPAGCEREGCGPKQPQGNSGSQARTDNVTSPKDQTL